MDGLRWILLGCGILLVAGIYLVDRYKRRTARNTVERSGAGDDTLDLNINPRAPDGEEDYGEAITDLNHLLNENREAASREADVAMDADIAMAWKRDDGNAPEAVRDDDSRDASTSHQQVDQLIVFYLKAPEGHAFAGPALFEALSTVGLSPGEMGIYHDTDSRNRTIFSLANMFEPGTLTTEAVDNFSTRGVALFMQLPGPVEPQDAFERMLAKAEILAERLDGELHDDQHRPLDDGIVAAIRQSLG